MNFSSASTNWRCTLKWIGHIAGTIGLLFVVLVVIAFVGMAQAQPVTDEAICRAAGIGAGNIADYKERYFDAKPHETMMVIASAKASLAKQPDYQRKKVDLKVVNNASPASWPAMQAALSEFGKLCPCGGQSPCSTATTNPVKVN